MLQRIRKVARDRLRKIADKFVGEIRIIWYIGVQKVLVQRKLGIGQQYRKLRPRQGLGALSSFRDFHVVRQKFDGAIKQLPLFQRLHQSLLEPEIFKAAAFDERQRQGLLVIVTQNYGGDLFGHAGQQDVAIVSRKAPVVQGNA